MDITHPFQGSMRPYSHQSESIRFMLANKKGYLFLSIGAGKTATSLWFADILFHAGKIKKVLIISPLSTLKTVWYDEVGNVCPNRKAVIVHGPRAKRMAALKSDAQIFITNTDCPRTYEAELLALKPDIIIIDEVTSFANHSSSRSKALQRICLKTKSVFGLTGSPVAGGLMNSYGIARVVNPSMLPTKFMSRYRSLIMDQVTMYEYRPRVGAEKIVHATLQPAIQFNIEDCIDLPDITYSTRMVELPKKTIDLFKEMLKHQIAEYNGGLITASTAGVKAIRLVQILTGSTKTEDGEIVKTDVTPKLNELLSIYHEAGCKLLVFTQSVQSVQDISEYLVNKGIDCDKIWGDVSLGNRSRIIDKFQSTESGVLVCQYRTMSHGITLTAASTVVFYGPISGNESMIQCIGRIRRLGQTKKQHVIRLISTKFEDRIFGKMDETNSMADTILSMYKEGSVEKLV